MTRFLSIKEVCARVGLSRTQITEQPPRAGMEDFPKHLKIGYRRFYVEEEVEAGVIAYDGAALRLRRPRSPPAYDAYALARVVESPCRFHGAFLVLPAAQSAGRS